MSPHNGCDLLSYKARYFLDNVCHYFVTTNSNFTQIRPDLRSFVGLKCNFCVAIGFNNGIN